MTGENAAPAEMPDELVRKVIEIVESAVNSAIPEPWEVSSRASSDILKLFAPILAEKERLERTIAARDRRIARLVWAMDYARSKGVVFPADTEPKVVLSVAAAIRAQE